MSDLAYAKKDLMEEYKKMVWWKCGGRLMIMMRWWRPACNAAVTSDDKRLKKEINSQSQTKKFIVLLRDYFAGKNVNMCKHKIICHLPFITFFVNMTLVDDEMKFGSVVKYEKLRITIK